MKRKRKIILFVIAFIIAIPVITLFVSRIARCCSYHSFTSSFDSFPSANGRIVTTSYLDTLSQMPVTIEFPKAKPNPNVSIGYAQFYIEPNDILAIRFAEQHTMVFIDCVDYHLGFFAPAVPQRMFHASTKEAGNQPGKAAALLKLMTEDLFEAYVKIAYAAPHTYPWIFLMSEDAYAEYSILCMFKTTRIHNQNGIAIFRTDNSKGIVRFGAAHEPAKMLAEIFNKDASLSQEIVVTSDSPEKSKQALLALLASYTLLIDHLPPRADLYNSILDSLRTNPRFTPESGNQPDN